MKVYLASPLGFAASTKQFLRELRSKLEMPGLTVVDPWSESENKISTAAARLPQGRTRTSRLRTANRRIAAANEASIRESDFMIAVLDGVDVDSGTASEIGFARGIGKPVIGLRTDFRRTGDNDGAVVNLQVEYWIETSGGKICKSVSQLVKSTTQLMASLEPPKPQ